MEEISQLHALAALLPEKEPKCPLDRWLGGPQNRSGRCGEEKNLILLGNRTPADQHAARGYIDCAIPIPTKRTVERITKKHKYLCFNNYKGRFFFQ
jgi:hypothetical protein